MRGQLHLRKTFAVRKESDVNQQKRSEMDHSTLKISSFISTNNFIILIHYSLFIRVDNRMDGFIDNNLEVTSIKSIHGGHRPSNLEVKVSNTIVRLKF